MKAEPVRRLLQIETVQKQKSTETKKDPETDPIQTSETNGIDRIQKENPQKLQSIDQEDGLQHMKKEISSSKKDTGKTTGMKTSEIWTDTQIKQAEKQDCFAHLRTSF